MQELQFILNSIHNDAAEPWQMGFQDSASPVFSGLVELHNKIGFFLIVISLSVFWVLFSLNYYYSSSNNPIAYKYLTHGTILVPTFFFKDIKHNNIKFIFLIYFAHILFQRSKETFKYFLDFAYQLFHLYSRQPNQYCLTVQGLAICLNSLIAPLEENSLKKDKIKTYTPDSFFPVQGEESECCKAAATRIFKRNYNKLEK